MRSSADRTPTDEPATSGTGTGPETGPRTATRFRWVALLVLLALAGAALAVLVTLFVQRTEAVGGGLGTRASALLSGQDPVQEERDAVMSPARQFMLRLNTYGPDLLDDAGQMPDYRAGVEELITPKFKASFEQGVTAAEQTVAQAGVERTAQVFATGVSSLDGDSARVLVAGSFTSSFPDPRDPSERVVDEPAPFRIEVSMVRTGGEWLVDDFTPITDAAEPAPGTGPAPSDLPTTPQQPRQPSPQQGGRR